jgi:hypothetical protein
MWYWVDATITKREGYGGGRAGGFYLPAFLCANNASRFLVFLPRAELRFVSDLFLLFVNFSDMNVKHLSHDCLFCKSVAHKVEPDARTEGAPSTHEVVFWFGF